MSGTLNKNYYDSAVICTAPILMPYLLLFAGFSIADGLVLMGIMITILARPSLPKQALKFSFVIWALICHSLITGFGASDMALGLLRLAKFSALIFYFSLISSTLDFQLLKRYLNYILFFCILVFFCQNLIFLLSNIAVPFVLPFFPLVNEDVTYENLVRELRFQWRPSGVFLEPSHFSYFLFLTALLINRIGGVLKFPVLVLIIGTLISTFSSFGFIAACLLPFLTFTGRLRDNCRYLFVFVFLVALAAFAFVSLPLVEITQTIPQIKRLIDPESVAISGRLYGGDQLFQGITQSQMMFGSGFGAFQIPGFVSGFDFIRKSFGISGIGLLLLLSVFHGFKFPRTRRYLIILWVMSLFTSVMLTPFIFLCLLLLKENFEPRISSAYSSSHSGYGKYVD